MITSARKKGKSRRFAALRSKVTQLADSNVDFVYWTWGSPPEHVKQPLTKARFEDTYLGAITAGF